MNTAKAVLRTSATESSTMSLVRRPASSNAVRSSASYPCVTRTVSDASPGSPDSTLTTRSSSLGSPLMFTREPHRSATFRAHPPREGSAVPLLRQPLRRIVRDVERPALVYAIEAASVQQRPQGHGPLPVGGRERKQERLRQLPPSAGQRSYGIPREWVSPPTVETSPIGRGDGRDKTRRKFDRDFHRERSGWCSKPVSRSPRSPGSSGPRGHPGQLGEPGTTSPRRRPGNAERGRAGRAGPVAEGER
jgi:hypothetical protein